MALLFKSTKMLEAQVDEFLDAVSQGAIVFKQGIKSYLENDETGLQESIELVAKLENRADNLRRQVENQLYVHSLIPENRGDVLGLLESMDDIIDTAKDTVNHFVIETPDIPMELIKDFMELADRASLAAESIVQATRAFFRDVNAVQDHLHKVYFYEKEADKIGDRLKHRVFRLKIDLSRKMHLSSFVKHVDSLADRAEEVADRVSIYTIKRSI